ncbi:MAG: metal-dependent hydrolase [Rhodothermales bacterium]
MPTSFTHAAFSFVAGRALDRKLSTTALVAGMAISALPDVDVVGLLFGIPYGHPLGHRGLTHSIAFALLSATVCWMLLRNSSSSPGLLWTFLFVSAVSHPLLDAMTNGGLGVAFFAPFTNTRYFFSFRPIEVSPIGADFFSMRGLRVLASEFVWVWIPAAIFAVSVEFVRRKRSIQEHTQES